MRCSCRYNLKQARRKCRVNVEMKRQGKTDGKAPSQVFSVGKEEAGLRLESSEGGDTPQISFPK